MFATKPLLFSLAGMLFFAFTAKGEEATQKVDVPIQTEATGGLALPGIDGVQYKLLRMPDDTEKKDGPHTATVFIFITQDCPIANGYAPEIRRIVETYTAKGIAFFLVHVDPDLSAENARKHAEAYALPAPILLDKEHLLVARLKITISPEAAIVAPNGALLYRGRIDDRYVELGKKRDEPKTTDLRDALEAYLQCKPIAKTETKAIGCSIGPLKRSKP